MANFSASNSTDQAAVDFVGINLNTLKGKMVLQTEPVRRKEQVRCSGARLSGQLPLGSQLSAEAGAVRAL